ncbi:MAG: hypothetical protein ACRDRO_06615 [Pseudonocardiaceae bacterium]
MCFPYAGGNAVNFQPIASAPRGGGLAVYTVELPGRSNAEIAAALSTDSGYTELGELDAQRAEHVDLHELADGGHCFLRTRPVEAAQAVLRTAELLASS